MVSEGVGVEVGVKEEDSSIIIRLSSSSSSSSLEMTMGEMDTVDLRLDFLSRTFMSPALITLCGKRSQVYDQEPVT